MLFIHMIWDRNFWLKICIICTCSVSLIFSLLTLKSNCLGFTEGFLEPILMQLSGAARFLATICTAIFVNYTAIYCQLFGFSVHINLMYTDWIIRIVGLFGSIRGFRNPGNSRFSLWTQEFVRENTKRRESCNYFLMNLCTHPLYRVSLGLQDKVFTAYLACVTRSKTKDFQHTLGKVIYMYM